MPSCRARASTDRTSAANARVGKARASESGQRRPLRLQAALQRLPDAELLLGPGQQPDRRGHAVGVRAHPVGEPAQQRVSEGVEGHHQRGDGGPAQPGGDPSPQVGGGAAGEGEHQDPVRRDPAALDPLDDRLDQGGGLARCPVRPAPAAGRPGGRRRPAARHRGSGRRAVAPACGSGGTSGRSILRGSVGAATPSLDQTPLTIRRPHARRVESCRDRRASVGRERGSVWTTKVERLTRVNPQRAPAVRQRKEGRSLERPTEREPKAQSTGASCQAASRTPITAAASSAVPKTRLPISAYGSR